MTALEPQFLEETVSTSAQELRSVFSPLQAGVMEPGDLKVATAAGTREVSVAAGIGFVRGSNVTDQGSYRIRNDGAISSLTFELGGITANGTAFPRIDQIVARVLDHTHDSSGLRKWRPEVVTGVATTGATLDNRTGAIADASIGNNWLRLADVLVPAGATTILAANIRDRRPWGRGAFWATNRTLGTMTTSSGSFVEMDNVNLKPRIECSGMPCRVAVSGFAKQDALTGAYMGLFDNSAQIAGTGRIIVEEATVNKNVNLSTSWVLTLAPGSHLLSPVFLTTSGTVSVNSNAVDSFLMTVEEILRPIASNT